MFKSFSIGLLCLIAGQAAAMSAAPDFPATFTGTLPCASCEGIQTRITFQADNTYFMSQTYLGHEGPNRADDLGRWVMSSHGNIAVLKGQRGDVSYYKLEAPDVLHMLDIEGRTILSELNYTLRRAAQSDSIDVKLFPLNGEYQYMADAGLFRECASGLVLPVMQAGDNARLESVYLEMRQEPGRPVFASVYGHVKMAPGAEEGSRKQLSLLPLRFESLAHGSCAPGLTAAGLNDQFWTLVQLNGKPVVLPENQRAPGLTFHADNNRLSGSGGCNQLVGAYTASQRFIDINMLAATRMACLTEGNVEQEFIRTLGQVKSWNILGQRLELYDQLGSALARFELP